MSDNINRAEGGGPWRLRLEHDLAATGHESTVTFDLTRHARNGRKAYFKPWLPMDEAMVKNLHDSAPVSVQFNGKFETFVEANAADVFDRAGITKIVVTNEGGTSIPADDLVIQVLVEPYGADDEARERKQRHPLTNMVRGTLNL